MMIIITIMTDNNNDDHNNDNANDDDDDNDNDIDNNNNRYAYAFSTRRCCDAQCIWECVGSSTFLCLGEVTDVRTETFCVLVLRDRNNLLCRDTCLKQRCDSWCAYAVTCVFLRKTSMLWNSLHHIRESVLAQRLSWEPPVRRYTLGWILKKSVAFFIKSWQVHLEDIHSRSIHSNIAVVLVSLAVTSLVVFRRFSDIHCVVRVSFTVTF